jgi:predicted ATPase
VPPWREIYETDNERRHGFEDAVAEYERLAKAYPTLGYLVMTLPKASVSERAGLILKALAE